MNPSAIAPVSDSLARTRGITRLLALLCMAITPCYGLQAATTAPELGSQTQTALEPETSDQYYSLERQIELGETQPAIQALEQQIQGIESAKHRYHSDLVKPLTLLGDAKFSAQDYPGALDAYGRAIHLTRVDTGLHAAEQVEGVYREAKVYLAVGDLQQANDREEYAWRVLQKAHGPYSAKLLPGIHHLADWYRMTYNVFAARGLYMRAVRIVEANYDEQHPEMVTALRGLANTYRLERFPPNYLNKAKTDVISANGRNPIAEDNSAILLNRFPRGEKALKRVVRIRQAALAALRPKIEVPAELVAGDPVAGDPVAGDPVAGDAADKEEPTATANADVEAGSSIEPSNQPPSDPEPSGADPEAIARAQQQLIAALVELGDWYLLFERSRIAVQFYAQAEAVGKELTPGYAKVDFSRPQLLHFPTPADPRPPKPKHRGERKQGFVELNYTITTRGSIANLETIGSSPKGLMDYRVRKSMLAARYRPSFVDGAPVATRDHTYRHQFDYYPSKPNPTSVPSPTEDPTVPTEPEETAPSVGAGL